MAETLCCSVCKEEKPFSCFIKRNDCKRGYTYECKVCRSLRAKAWRAGHVKYFEKYRGRYSEKIKERRKNDGAILKAASKRSYRKHRDARLKEGKLRYQNNKALYVAKVALRKARKLQATPSWANLEYINDMYVISRIVSEATGIKYHVDHVVPLSSPLVCGLHVPSNLEVVPASSNLSKCNTSWPEMP